MSFGVNHTNATDFQGHFPDGGAGVVTAFYTRVSRSKGGIEQSIDDQIRQCRAYAEAHGATVHPGHIIEDLDEDSYDLTRPAFQRLLAAGDRGEVHAVIFCLQERLARGDAFIAANYLLRLHHIAVCCIDEPLNRGMVDTVLRSLGSGMGRESIKKAVKRGRDSRLADGKLLTGCRPRYGYAWKSVGEKAGQRKIAYYVDRDDPDCVARAGVVGRIFASIDRGVPLNAIARDLTAERIPTPNGAPEWTRQTVAGIAHWPGYAGAYRALGDTMHVKVLGKRTMKGFQRVPRPAGEAVDLPDAVEPIVSRELFDAVQGRLAENRARSPRRLPNPEAFLCYQRVVCGVCGNVAAHKNHRATKRQPAHATYAIKAKPDGHRDCANNTTIRAAILDELVWADIARAFSSRERVGALLDELRRADPTEATRAQLARDIARLGRQQDALLDALNALEAGSARRRAAEKVNALGQQEDALRRELGRQEEQHAAWLASQEQTVALETALARLGERLGDPRVATPAFRREVCELLRVRVRLWKAAQGHAADGTPIRHRTTVEVAPDLALDATTTIASCAKSARLALDLPRAAD